MRRLAFWDLTGSIPFHLARKLAIPYWIPWDLRLVEISPDRPRWIWGLGGSFSEALHLTRSEVSKPVQMQGNTDVNLISRFFISFKLTLSWQQSGKTAANLQQQGPWRGVKTRTLYKCVLSAFLVRMPSSAFTWEAHCPFRNIEKELSKSVKKIDRWKLHGSTPSLSAY